MTSDPQSKTFLQSPDTLIHLEKSPSAKSGNGAALVLCSVSVACLSGLMMGYEMSLISGALLQLRDALTLSCPEQEQVVGSLLFGAFLLSLGGGTILDRYGRRFSIILTALLCVLGTLLCVCVVSFWALVVGRMLVGMAVALSGTASCLYAAEVAPATWRGRCVCVYELMVVLGMLLGFGLSWAFAGVPDGWRFTFAGVLLPALLQASIMPLLPQSPRFLLAQQRGKEAHATLLRLRAGIEGVDAVEDELQAIRMALGAERSTASWTSSVPQATGQPNILAYASTVLSSVGFHGNEAATLASTGFGVVKVGGTIPAVFLVDKVGPKALLCVGAVIMTLSTATLGAVTMQSRTHVSSLCKGPINKANLTVLGMEDETDIQTNTPLGLHQPSDYELQTKHKLDPFHTNINDTKGHWILNYTYDHRTALMDPAEGSSKIALQSLHVNEVSPSLKWISLVSLLVYVAGFSISLGPMVHVVLSAIFPTGIRGKAVSVISAFNWATNLLISMTFLTMTERIGLPTVIFSYAAMSFVLVVFVIVFVPETKGRSLEQISKELAMNRMELGFIAKNTYRHKHSDEIPAIQLQENIHSLLLFNNTNNTTTTTSSKKQDTLGFSSPDVKHQRGNYADGEGQIETEGERATDRQSERDRQTGRRTIERQVEEEVEGNECFNYSYFVLSLRLRLYTREATMPFRSGQGSFFTRHRITVSLPLLIFNQAARPLRTNDFLFLTDGRPRARVTPVEQPVVTANGWTRERASCPQSCLAQLTQDIRHVVGYYIVQKQWKLVTSQVIQLNSISHDASGEKLSVFGTFQAEKTFFLIRSFTKRNQRRSGTYIRQRRWRITQLLW
ncbi:solute carrier family 2, facilitated glucose transporter [Pimephales promelas]|nr:solute carrier family 2, facilitated glucose transporter [Pimephales promelas]